MTTCDRYQSWMVEAVYGELDDARRVEFDAHVGECADCAALFSELQATAGLMSRRRRPDPGPEFWGGYGRRLQERIAREEPGVDASRFARRRSLGSWGYRVAAAVAVLAAGVWLGRTVLSPSPDASSPRVATTTPVDSTPRRSAEELPSPQGVTGAGAETRLAQGEERRPPIDAPAGEKAASPDCPADTAMTLVSGEDEAQRYIARSQLLLLTVLNGNPEDEASFDAQRQRAGELVQVASSVREGSNDRRVQELVGQLELILREIAHLEAGSDVESVEVIRSRVSRESVLLRINLEQMRAEKTAHDGPID